MRSTIRTAALAIAGILLLCSLANAQTQEGIAWNYDATTVEDVATYAQRVVVNGNQLNVAPTCVQDGANVTCSAPVKLLAGENTIRISATKNDVTKEVRFIGVNPLNGPKEPNSPRVHITVTITVPPSQDK